MRGGNEKGNCEVSVNGQSSKNGEFGADVKQRLEGRWGRLVLGRQTQQMLTMLNEWDNLIHSVICLLLKKLKLQCYRDYKSGSQET